jgi:hypothetical protein
MFEVITVVVVLGIFSAFAVGAHFAEKTVTAKAQAKREAAKARVAEKPKAAEKATKKSK